jgi:hypothetical protein
MRRCCVHFFERVGANEDPCDAAVAGRHLFRENRWRMHDYWFGEALGELRSGVGLPLTIVGASFGLDIEGDLARTLPDPEDHRSRPPRSSARRSAI